MAYSSTSFQFTHLLQRVYDKLEQTKGLIATSGSSTTIIEDTTLSTEYDDTQFVGHTAFVVRDAAGAGAAPEGEFQRVSSYDATNKQLTVSAFTAAVATGDEIILARNSQFPLYDVKRICTNALRALGPVRTVDTSLTTADSQTDYNFPSGVLDIVKVEIQGNTSDSNDNQYFEVPFKKIPPSSIGGTRSFTIAQYDSGRTIRLTVIGPHAKLSDYDDDISDDIYEELAVAACALACARWKRSATEQTILPRLEVDYAYAIQKYPIRYKPSKRYALYGLNEYHYPGDQDVILE